MISMSLPLKSSLLFQLHPSCFLRGCDGCGGCGDDRVMDNNGGGSEATDESCFKMLMLVSLVEVVVALKFKEYRSKCNVKFSKMHHFFHRINGVLLLHLNFLFLPLLLPLLHPCFLYLH